MIKSIFIAKGISGSGKSSRVFQLLKFFESCGLTLSDFKYTNVEEKEKIIGVLVEELNLIFVGKIYRSGEVERWQGYDAVTGAFKKAEYFSKFLKENLDKYSFIVEGAGITQTHRLRPKFLQEIGFEDILIQYYNYPEDGKQEYYNRIIYRSGEKPKKDVMWDKNIGFINDCKFSRKELAQCTDESFINVFENDFKTPIFDFGSKLIVLMNDDRFETADFIKFTEEFDYINKNKFENFQ